MFIEKPLYRYGSLDSGPLCKLFRSDDVFIPSADDNTNPGDIMRFIDIALLNPQIFILGRDPRYEAFVFSPNHNLTTFYAHIAIRKDKRDGEVVKKVAEAGHWILKNTTCQSVMALVLEKNNGIRSVLGQLGMSRRGKLKKSVLFGGELRDELLYQITKEEFCAIWPEGKVNK